MQRICVYAGSNVGARSEYQEAAAILGKELVKRGLGLVYGGGQVGLMGVLANAVMANGGEVTGIMPDALFPNEVANQKVTHFYKVGSMHERKAKMAELSDGFIALPGGFGTYDELFEMITWQQIGIHHKPVGLLNVAGYFNPLLTMVRHSSEEGFISSKHASLLLQEETPAALLDAFESYRPIEPEGKWRDLPRA